MSNLPFLKPKGLPTERKLSGVSRYGFDEDDELIDTALDELIKAMDEKDHKKIIHCIHCLSHFIKNRGEKDVETQKETVVS